MVKFGKFQSDFVISNTILEISPHTMQDVQRYSRDSPPGTWISSDTKSSERPDVLSYGTQK